MARYSQAMALQVNRTAASGLVACNAHDEVVVPASLPVRYIPAVGCWPANSLSVDSSLSQGSTRLRADDESTCTSAAAAAHNQQCCFDDFVIADSHHNHIEIPLDDTGGGAWESGSQAGEEWLRRDCHS